MEAQGPMIFTILVKICIYQTVRYCRRRTSGTIHCQMRCGQDPQKLVDVLDKIGHIDVPLEELEEHIKLKQAEKETLQHEIDEARAIIDMLMLIDRP